MNDTDHQIEPFQLWLKDRCIWAEAHQKTLFYGLLLFVALIACLTAIHGGFTIGVALWLGCAFWAAVTGALAAAKNRNIWGWGVIGGGWLGIVILLFLRPLCGSCLKPIANAERKNETCSKCGQKRISRYA